MSISKDAEQACFVNHRNHFIKLLFLFCVCCSPEETSANNNETDACDGDFDFGNFCFSQKTKDDCELANSDLPNCNWDDHSGHQCKWRVMVETSIDEEGNCQFGESRSYCEYSSDRGEDQPVWLPFVLCYGTYSTYTAFYSEEVDTTLLGAWTWKPDYFVFPSLPHCTWQTLDGGVGDAGSQEGELISGADECICVCDPDYPMALPI